MCGRGGPCLHIFTITRRNQHLRDKERGAFIRRRRRTTTIMTLKKKIFGDSRTNLAVDVSHLSMQNHSADFPLHLQTLERRPLGLGELHGLRNNPLVLQVHLKSRDECLSDENLNIKNTFNLAWNVSAPPHRCFPGQAVWRSCAGCHKDVW